MSNCQWPPCKIFSRRKTTGLFIFTTAKMQPSQTSKSKAKSQISYSRLGLVKLDLQKKSSFIILILLIWTLTQCFPYWNSPRIERGESKTHGLYWWKNMPCVGIKDFGRNRTQYSTQLWITGSCSWTKHGVLTSFPLKRAGGRLSGISQCCMERTFAITRVDGSPSVPAYGQTTRSEGFCDLHIQTLLFPTEANEAPSWWGKTLRWWQPADTHDKSGFFSTRNSQNTPIKYSFSHNTLFSHYVCWHFSDWPQLDILFRSPHLVEHLNNNTLKHAQSLFWSPFRLCPGVSGRIPAMMHGPSAVQV